MKTVKAIDREQACAQNPSQGSTDAGRRAGPRQPLSRTFLQHPSSEISRSGRTAIINRNTLPSKGDVQKSYATFLISEGSKYGPKDFKTEGFDKFAKGRDSPIVQSAAPENVPILCL